MSPSHSRVLFLWGQFGPYHIDRADAAALDLSDREVVGLEVTTGANQPYTWATTGSGERFAKTTVFPGDTFGRANLFARILRIVSAGVALRARHNFLCNYDLPEIFLLAIVLRLLRRRVFVMWETKFDDRPRYLWREVFKWIFLLPYHGALTSGARARSYLTFFGKGARIADGYDSISVARLRRLAGVLPAPAGPKLTERHFIVIARMVAKKNLIQVIAAYDLYRHQVEQSALPLLFLGTGPIEESLKAEVRMRGLTNVHFLGFVQAEDVAKKLSQSAAMILPSIEEQWGLVVNEALALGIPVLCAENVGACDLIREGRNGYIFPPDDAERLADLLKILGHDEAHWISMASTAADGAGDGDAVNFAKGARMLIEMVP